MKFTFSILIFFFLMVVSCAPTAEEEEEKSTDNDAPAITNPNGMSEMSLIMEEWYVSMKEISDNLRKGKIVKSIRKFDEEKLLTAKTTKTDLKKVHFEAFSNSFFYNYNQIAKAISIEKQVDAFNLTVTSCVNCHEQYCHGPLVRIKKLTLQP